MRLDFHTLDVFTDIRFGGNPLAVVLGADQLDDAQMQTIAREFNISETVFVSKAKQPAHSAAVRIFTPEKEIPFAGHPNVGTAVLLAELKTAGLDGDGHDSIVTLEQQVGIVRVGVRLKSGEAGFAEFDAPKLPTDAGALPPVEKLAAGVGLIAGEIGFENHKPRCFAAGPAFAMIPVRSLEAIEKAHVSHLHWAAAFQEQGIVGAYLYTRRCVHTDSSFHARMFAPEYGILEDPATGSAAICLAAAVHHFDDLPDGSHKHCVEQGYEMGRPSTIKLTSVVRSGELETIRIGGRAVRITDGQINI
ncbi:MAG: PhzF family phenazine biosynthesis protein [Alphaproteobacteria bacterium]|nr:PhzF family phenazine biosynthesis protein [Alphaproteobacteria bacterium]